ncbi:MAG: LLM class flavin-dependent oxidoreductase [Actinobacteria bacterium]|nr:LLM class flavin-dependent oxidoreductase [Actinomycetota bacterium]
MTTLEFGVLLPQLGAGWDQARRFARHAEDGGFDSVWVADHLLGLPPEKGILEAWTVMSAVAAVTDRVGIGAQVLCQSFRGSGLLAKMATTLDLVSGGRLRFLVGAGWYEAEYDAFGFEFPPAGQRVEETEDTIRICRAMFDAGGEPVTYEGHHLSVHEVVNVPPPQRPIPIGVGCTGDRMLDVTARLADEWNYPATALGRYDERRRTFDERVAEHGREVRRSTQIVFSPGERELPPFYDMFRPDLGIRGSRDQMVDRVGALAAAGLTGFYGFVADEQALDELAEALPDLRAVVDGSDPPPVG